jgi:hypothetical protein
MRKGFLALISMLVLTAAMPASARGDITNVTPPVISGTPEPGNTLSCSDGTWSEPYHVAQKVWLRDGGVFFGGTGDTYDVVESDVGSDFVCRVRGASDITESAEDAYSAPVTINAASPDPPADPSDTGTETPVEQPSVGQPPTVSPVIQTPLPPAASVIQFPSGSARCGSRRNFRIRIRQVRGVTYKNVKVFVNGRPSRVTRSDRFRSTVDLRKLPYGTFKVKIVVTTSDARTIEGTRKYRTCRTKRLPGRKRRL